MNLRPLLPALPLAALLTGCDDASAGGILAGGIGLYAIGSIILLILLIYAVVDLIQQPYPTSKKIIWGLIILIIPYLGAIAYLLIGRNGKEVF